MANWVEIHKEVMLDKLFDEESSEWRLCFHKVTYHYDGNEAISQDGYRFMWRQPGGNLQTARGQARIPTPEDMFALLNLASEEGWFKIPEKR